MASKLMERLVLWMFIQGPKNILGGGWTKSWLDFHAW